MPNWMDKFGHMPPESSVEWYWHEDQPFSLWTPVGVYRDDRGVLRYQTNGSALAMETVMPNGVRCLNPDDQDRVFVDQDIMQVRRETVRKKAVAECIAALERRLWLCTVGEDSMVVESVVWQMAIEALRSEVHT